MISGEYAVLGGATALVAAVDLRARVSLSHQPHDRSRPAGAPWPHAAALPPEVVLSRREAERALGTLSVDLSLDTTALRVGDRKLGVGSSAAGAVAAAGAIVAAHGRTLESEPVRREVLRFALDGHRAIAPQGSGIDVAASALGGWLRFRRDGDRAVVDAIAWPEGLVPLLFWTGTPARTSELVAAVELLHERDAPAHARAIAPIVEASATFVSAIEGCDASAAIEALDAHGRAMAELGRAAGAPIVTEALATVAALARELGGAAKPSGAGGGDVAIALVRDAASAARLEAACAAAGIERVLATLGAEGVRREPAGEGDSRW